MSCISDDIENSEWSEMAEFSNEYNWDISIGPLYGWNDVRSCKGPTEIGFLNLGAISMIHN